MKITRFEELDCWKEARELTRLVYQASNSLPFRKNLRLCGQIQAAATSAMANIAEGFIRRSDKEFIQFLFIAMSSVAEVQSHLYVAVDQQYIGEGWFKSTYGQAEKTARIISALITYLRTNQTKQTRQTRRPARPE